MQFVCVLVLENQAEFVAFGLQQMGIIEGLQAPLNRAELITKAHP